jgi:hypothetical protein
MKDDLSIIRRIINNPYEYASFENLNTVPPWPAGTVIFLKLPYDSSVRNSIKTYSQKVTPGFLTMHIQFGCIYNFHINSN